MPPALNNRNRRIRAWDVADVKLASRKNSAKAEKHRADRLARHQLREELRKEVRAILSA